MDEFHERRNVNGHQRKSRVKLGSVSAPIAILITWGITNVWGQQMSQEVVIALATLVGSMVSVLTICFWDLRSAVFKLIYSRRHSDGSK